MTDPRHIEYASLLLALLIGCLALLASTRTLTTLDDALAEPTRAAQRVKQVSLHVDDGQLHVQCSI